MIALGCLGVPPRPQPVGTVSQAVTPHRRLTRRIPYLLRPLHRAAVQLRADAFASGDVPRILRIPKGNIREVGTAPDRTVTNRLISTPYGEDAS